jgi:hypothetical protein
MFIVALVILDVAPLLVLLAVPFLGIVAFVSLIRRKK